MKDRIEHIGTVSEINGNRIRVLLKSESMCSSCHARTVCEISDSKIKAVDAIDRNGESYVRGETVMLVMKKSSGYKAVLISYVIPLTIILVLLLTLSGCGLDEPVAALVSILAVGMYYFFIYLFRNRIAGKTEFEIRKVIQ